VNNNQERLAVALESLAAQIASAPRTIIGNKVSVSAGPGSSGTVIGQKITAIGGPGGGRVTGMKVNVSNAGPDPAADLTQELRDAATAVRQDKENRAWLTSLLGRVRALTDRVVDVTATTVLEQAIKAAFG
jgi:hypothetical protein